MKANKLVRRLEELEKNHSSGESIILLMPNGRTETLPGEEAVRLLGAALRNDWMPEMDLIARSVSSTEPDGAHMIDLARALLNGPKEDSGAEASCV